MQNPILKMLNTQSTNQSLPTSLNDPRMQQAKEYVAKYGGNPKAAFYALCKQKMLDPNNVMRMVMGRGR